MTEEQKPEENKAEISSERDAAAPKQEKSPAEPSMAARAIRWIFRMLVTILLGIALGAGIYYGARNFYRDAIEPLQTIDQRMREIETSASELGATVRKERTSTSEEIAELRGNLSTQVEEIASISAQISRLETRIENQAEALDEVADLRDELHQVELDLEDTDERMQALEAIVEAGELPAERVRETLQLMRTMNLMTRARLWIEQDNFGLAAEDIQTALEIMGPLVEEADPESETGSRLQELSDRLTVAAEIVRSNPGLAEEELEIVWKLLIEASAP